MKKRILITVGAVLITTSVAGTAFAASVNPGMDYTPRARKLTAIHNVINKKTSQIFGMITGINGSSFVLQLKSHGKNATTTDFTVNTSSTTVFTKNGQPASLSDLSLQQRVRVAGVIDKNAKTIAATKVKIMIPSENKVVAVMGVVQSISGNSITLTAKNGSSRVVDATSAKIFKGMGKKAQAIALADIAVGDRIMAKGAVQASSTNIVATSIWDIIKK